jgi:hypothetical protein
MLLPAKLTSTSCERIIRLLNENWQRWDISVSVVIRLWVARFKSQQEQLILVFSKLLRLSLGPTQPPILWVLGALSIGVKCTGCKIDH